LVGRLRLVSSRLAGWFRGEPSPHRPRVGQRFGPRLAHIGVIDALIEAGIEPDIVCGASMARWSAGLCRGHLAGLRHGRRRPTWRKIARLTTSG